MRHYLREPHVVCQASRVRRPPISLLLLIRSACRVGRSPREATSSDGKRRPEPIALRNGRTKVTHTTMADHRRSTEDTNDSWPLRRIILDESLNVWIGLCGSMAEIEAAMGALSALPGISEVTLVLSLPRDLRAPEATCALARAGTIATTLVVVASDDDRLRWGALWPNDLCAVVRGSGGDRVLLEPAPERAVVASMQWLRAGDTFCVLWPRKHGLLSLHAAIGLGASWRGAWDDPENGEFHSFPRGPDGSYADVQHAIDENSSPQGANR